MVRRYAVAALFSAVTAAAAFGARADEVARLVLVVGNDRPLGPDQETLRYADDDANPLVRVVRGTRRHAHRNDINPKVGSGRLRMRRFNSSGMDATWFHTTTGYTFSSSNNFKYWYAFPDASNVNQAIPSDVDALSATAFCYYDGFDYSTLPTINFRLFNSDAAGATYAADSEGEKAIVRINPANQKYEVRLTIGGLLAGETVPCWVNWMWEDSARNDADGPPSSIDPYPVAGSVNADCSNGC